MRYEEMFCRKCLVGFRGQLDCPCRCGGTCVFCTKGCLGNGYTEGSKRTHDELKVPEMHHCSLTGSIEYDEEIEAEILKRLAA